jgi:hypothetical protein
VTFFGGVEKAKIKATATALWLVEGFAIPPFAQYAKDGAPARCGLGGRVANLSWVLETMLSDLVGVGLVA